VALTVVVLSIAIGGPAGASMPNAGDGSQTGDGSTPFTGLAQAPEANLFIGSATTGLLIQVPPGRRSMTPSLALSYASNGGPSPYGLGWDLPIPRIQRSTKEGALLCRAKYQDEANSNYTWVPDVDPLRDEFVATMAGASIECTRGSSGICVPHVEEAFVRIKYDSSNKTFVAWDKSGTRFAFGESSTATAAETGEPATFPLPARTGSSLDSDFVLVGTGNPSIVPTCSYIYSWALTSVEDTYGNRMELRYRLISGVLYPHSIVYGGNLTASPSISHLFKVAFAWEDRLPQDRPSSSIGGFRATTSKRLAEVALTSSGQAVRGYLFEYEDDRRGRQSLLAGVSLKGSNGMVLSRADGEAAAAAFVYRETAPIAGNPDPYAVAGFDTARTLPRKPELGTPSNALRWHDNGLTRRDVFDINGDGFADLVDASPAEPRTPSAAWKVYLGSRDGFGNTFICWHLPSAAVMNVIRGKGNPVGNQLEPVKKATLDLTGDGIADFIDASATTWVVYRGTATSSGGGWGFAAGANWSAPFPGLQLSTLTGGAHPDTLVTRDLIDMNGDGLVDLVGAAGPGATYWSWYQNTGDGFNTGDGVTPLPQRFDTGVSGLRLSHTNDDHGMRYGTFDVTGDGFPDHVNADGPTANTWQVCVNTGQGLAPCESWPVPPNFGQAGFVRKSLASEPQDTTRDFFDINGDGLPDIVDKTNYSDPGNKFWEVLVNRGAGFEQTPTKWRAPRFIRNGSPGGGGVMEDTSDIDGDGLVDHVVFDDSGGSSENYSIYRLFDGAWKVPPSGLTAAENPSGMRRDLLLLSEAGNGGSTVLRYRPATQWTNTALPFRLWTVTELEHRDGLCPPGSTLADGSCSVPGHEVGTAITYANGRFDPIEREFRGFGEVMSEAIVDDAVPHAATTTYFHQTPTLAGKISGTATWDAGGSGTFLSSPIGSTGNTWECAHPVGGAVITCPAIPAGDVWVRLKRTDESAYSGSLALLKTRFTVNESWHSCAPAGGGGARVYGNVAHARRGASVGAPKLHTHTEYACRDDVNGYLVDRPVHVLVRDETNKVLEEKWFWYDDGAFGSVVRGGATRSDSLVDGNDTNPVPACAQSPAAAGGCIPTYTVIDGVGNVTAVTDGLGRTTNMAYDLDRLYPLVITQPLVAVGVPRHSAKTVHDPRCGTPLSISIPYTAGEPLASESTRHEYDAYCRLTRTRIPGDLDTETAFATYLYQIGAPGYPTRTTTLRREPSAALGLVTSAIFADGLGRVLQSKAATVIGGSAQAVATGTTTYDALGRPTATYVPFAVSANYMDYVAPSAAVGRTTYAYDAIGRATTIDTPGPGHRTADHTVAWETTTKDECATSGGACSGQRVVERRDALGRTIERLAYEGSVLQARTAYAFDAQNRLVSTTQGDAGGWNANTAVTATYDTLGRKVRTVDPDSGTSRYRYDRAGALIMQDDPTANRHLEFCYDGMGRITKKRYVAAELYDGDCGANSSEQVTYAYTLTLNGLGRPLSIVDQTGQTVFNQYNVRGQVLTERRIMNGVTAETQYSYDSAGKLFGMLYPDNESVLYGYGLVGRPNSLRSAAANGPTYLQSVTYDVFGRPLRVTHGNGTSDERTYHDASESYRLARIHSRRGAATTLFNFGYPSYTRTGLLESISDDGWQAGVDPPAMTARATFVYDGLGRLKEADDLVPGAPVRLQHLGQHHPQGRRADHLHHAQPPASAHRLQRRRQRHGEPRRQRQPRAAQRRGLGDAELRLRLGRPPAAGDRRRRHTRRCGGRFRLRRRRAPHRRDARHAQRRRPAHQYPGDPLLQ